MQLAPSIAGLDPINPLSPRIERNMARRRSLRRFRERKNICSHAMPEAMEIGLDRSAHLLGQSPPKISAQQRIVVVLILEPRPVLNELGHAILYTRRRSDSPAGASAQHSPHKSELGGVQ